LPDGRLLIQFRDNNPTNRPGNYLSPTEGDWVGWVGTYDDLKNGYEGEYRIRFRDNKKHKDTAYPASELLPDGTLVCTSYGHWEKDEPPYIISFRFKIETLDSMARDIRKNGQRKVNNDMTGIE
jgi:hypothetical protein